MTLLNNQTHIACNLTKAHVGNRRQNRRRLRRDILTILDTEEIGSSALFNVFMLGSIEVHDIRITHFMSLFARQQAGRIVASDLHIACSTWSSAVLFPVDSNPNRFDSRFKIGSDGRTVDNQQGFLGRFHAQSDRRSEHHRTQIERSSRTVGRNETLVALDDLDAGIDNHFNRRNRQAQAFRRGLETPRIVGNAEKTHFSVYTAEGLETLEKFDAVVQA